MKFTLTKRSSAEVLTTAQKYWCFLALVMRRSRKARHSFVHHSQVGKNLQDHMVFFAHSIAAINRYLAERVPGVFKICSTIYF
jgi:hypothetical protein